MMTHLLRTTLYSALIITCSTFSRLEAAAELKLAGIFSDNMVLQQECDAAIWGRAEVGAEVELKASWGGGTERVKADADGKWKTTLKTPSAGGPFKVTVTSGDDTVELKNVLSGEVWLCTGQSNMQWKMRGFGPEEFKDDLDKAGRPEIRLVTLPQVLALEEQEDAGAKWQVCTPGTAGNFSAVGYFFGSIVQQEIDVPVGLVSTNWGGSSAEAWTSSAALEKGFPEFRERMDSYAGIIDETGVVYSRNVQKPKGLNHRNPAVLYNSMIKPLIPFAMRGVIWYQGESNVKDPVQYRKLFPAMIRDWRENWGIGDFPFYFVQIAPYHYKTEKIPVAFLREAQMMALSEPNTGMVVTMDVGDPTNIHPRGKKPVGERLAKLALSRTYGKKGLVDSGPIYSKMRVEGDRIRLGFNHVGGGLVSRDGGKLTHFTIAGADRKFVEAEAVIDRNSVVVSSAEVANPVAVRYGWGNADEPNLANKEGLPSPSFRTDDWEIGE